jgi:hypothetical protein
LAEKRPDGGFGTAFESGLRAAFSACIGHREMGPFSSENEGFLAKNDYFWAEKWAKMAI